MALPRVHFVVGFKADGSTVPVYCGTVGADAIGSFEAAVQAETFAGVQLFRFPEASKSRSFGPVERLGGAVHSKEPAPKPKRKKDAKAPSAPPPELPTPSDPSPNPSPESAGEGGEGSGPSLTE